MSVNFNVYHELQCLRSLVAQHNGLFPLQCGRCMTIFQFEGENIKKSTINILRLPLQVLTLVVQPHVVPALHMRTCFDFREGLDHLFQNWVHRLIIPPRNVGSLHKIDLVVVLVEGVESNAPLNKKKQHACARQPQRKPQHIDRCKQPVLPQRAKCDFEVVF